MSQPKTYHKHVRLQDDKSLPQTQTTVAPWWQTHREKEEEEDEEEEEEEDEEEEEEEEETFLGGVQRKITVSE